MVGKLNGKSGNGLILMSLAIQSYVYCKKFSCLSVKCKHLGPFSYMKGVNAEGGYKLSLLLMSLFFCDIMIHLEVFATFSNL